MPIQIIDQPLTALGGFGRSLAQGLESTLPQAIERGMLSQGLKNLERDAPNMTQMEIAARMLGYPGGKEALPILEPMLRGLRGQGIQGAITNTETGQPQQPQQAQPQQPQQAQPQQAQTQQAQPQQEQAQGYAQRELDPNFGVLTSPQELAQEAERISRGGKYPFNEVFDSLEKRDAKRAARELAIQARNELGQKFFNEDLETFVQKSGNEIFKDIIGEMNLDYRKKVFADIERGESPKKAAETHARDLLEFAKVRNGVKSQNNINFLTDRKKAESELSATRKKYEEKGALNLLADDLVAYKKMSKPYANSIAYPVSESIKTEIDRLGRFAGRIQGKVSPSKIFDKISRLIKPSDSLQSIALYAEKNGLNAKSFLVYMEDKNKNNEISLTDRQNRELAEDVSFRPSLADVFYSPKSLLHYL